MSALPTPGVGREVRRVDVSPLSANATFTVPGTALAPSNTITVNDDPMTRAHVDVSASITGGSIRLASASGPLEALWLHLRDEDGNRVVLDRATGQHLAAAVRLTPSQARTLADLLTRYADSHEETADG